MTTNGNTLGTGGGDDPEATPDRYENIVSNYRLAANQIAFLSRPALPPTIPGPSNITLLAAGADGDGTVDVRGNQGIRLTAGPPRLLPTSSPTTNGVEIEIGQEGKFTLQRGLAPAVQKLEVTSEGVTIDAGSGKVTIQSQTEITLSVANGSTKIKLGPEGVTIEALQIKLSAQLQAEIQALMSKITGSATTQISGGLIQIG